MEFAELRHYKVKLFVSYLWELKDDYENEDSEFEKR